MEIRGNENKQTKRECVCVWRDREDGRNQKEFVYTYKRRAGSVYLFPPLAEWNMRG